MTEIVAREGRTSDSVYRYGGEELAVIMTEQSLQSAGTALERIRRAVQSAAIAHPTSPTAPVVTISVGVAERRSGDASDGRNVLNRADTALYRAKSNGRNQVTQFEDA